MEKAVLLLSGGIDSAVAADLAKKNGVELIALHFASQKITGIESLEKSRKLAKMLGIKNFFYFDASDKFVQIARECTHKYYFVLMKRFMLRVAYFLAIKNKAKFIVTGESLGQVSSQTLSNLSVIDSAVKMPVLRPLLSFDKEEIVKIARQIGTLEESTGKEMCDALGPAHPATKTEEQTILEEEKKLPYDFWAVELLEEKL